MIKNFQIAVVGLGYVGLPLLCLLSKKFHVKGYDINKEKIKNLNNLLDETKEVTKNDLRKIKNKIFSSIECINKSNFFIVTVPTPIDSKNHPDLRFLESACKNLAKIIKKGDIVVFESTVYPGLTEEYCGSILEKNSNLKVNKDFFFRLFTRKS